MVFANIGKQTRNVPPNIRIWNLDTRNDLYGIGDSKQGTGGADSLPGELLLARYLPLPC